MIEMQHALADTVRERLKEKGMSQAAIAREIGVSQMTISAFLNKRLKLGDLTLFKIQKWVENGGVTQEEEQRRAMVAFLQSHGITNAVELYTNVLRDLGYSYSSAKTIFNTSQKQYASEKLYEKIREAIRNSTLRMEQAIEEPKQKAPIKEVERKPTKQDPYTTILEWMACYDGEFTRTVVIEKLKEVLGK